MYPMSRDQIVAYRGVRTKNHMKPTPITMPGNEKDKKLKNSRRPEAKARTLTMV